MPTMPATLHGDNAQQAAIAAAEAQANIRANNRKFMALALNKEALAQQANGGANSQAWVAGQPLVYNMPSTNNAYLTGFWLRFTGTVTLPAGTGAAYALTAAGQLALYDSVQVLVNGKQHDFRPYIMKYLVQLMGQSQQVQPRLVVAGQTDSPYQAYLNTGLPTLVAVNATTFALWCPMNLIHPQDVRGILSIQNGQSPVQVIVNCAGAVIGPDPELNAIYLTAGTNTVPATVAAQISVIAIYKDGQSYAQRDPLVPNLGGMETCQLLRDNQLSNMQTGQIMSGKITYLHKIPWLIVVAIDGNQSNKFSATTNIQVLRTTTDQNGLHPFIQYGLNSNMDVKEFYTDLSGAGGGLLKQDIDEGVFPFVYGPIFQQAEAGVQEGAHYLNMTQDTGWTDWHYGIQFAALGQGAGGSAGIQPRCTVHVVILNDPLSR